MMAAVRKQIEKDETGDAEEEGQFFYKALSLYARYFLFTDTTSYPNPKIPVPAPIILHCQLLLNPLLSRINSLLMACGLSHKNHSIVLSSLSKELSISIHKPLITLNLSTNLRDSRYFSIRHSDRKKRSVVVAGSCGEQRRCSGSLNSPLEPTSSAGRSLSRVLQNDPVLFYDAVSDELNRLAVDRDGAIARMNLSCGSDEACLHRRIAKLKEHECQVAIEDVMYMIIFYKFREIKVPLIPRLHECLYNGRLEILPSKDWELETIHSLDVLEMIKEYLTTVLGWNPRSSVVVNWSITRVQKLCLSRVYAASILFGYFLKSASLRHNLEQNLPETTHDIPSGNCPCVLESGSCILKNLVLDQIKVQRSTTMSRVSNALGKKGGNLRCYMMGFDPGMLQVCGRMKSKAAMDLVENHCSALFGITESSGGRDEVILTSLSSLKRLVLEAIAFGCFLWDAEEHVDGVYRLMNEY
ncbi:hypothetical protein Nepgr_004312 [Nepenthes gracilis]|uniref:UV-B-induced protein At3g17800, chloroplastic-like n=1 Tax=Nepenthes gracilis TaxID=150966 RepID=A0AAD3XEZ4_NEPGR|nr:hypothetical protein Nepgr_004312 [Nepenthes gracilis]